MKWSQEAEAAVKKVPFFVRKRVRARVEEEALRAGREIVGIEDVYATQKKYLSGMESEIKGYQIEACFGPTGCPNRANPDELLVSQLEEILSGADLLRFLKERVKGELKFHHEFRVAVSDCPNACSQPQIKDIGIIGACAPRISGLPCSACRECVEACREDALILAGDPCTPTFDLSRCLACGRCIGVCHAGAIETGARGFRVQLGGKLGRHPRLARELSGIFTRGETLRIVRDCIDLYKRKSAGGERFSEILSDPDFEEIERRYGKG